MSTKKDEEAAAAKAGFLNRGINNRAPGTPSATPIPPEKPRRSPRTDPGEGRAPAGEGRRGHLRKLTLELTPEDHMALKRWLLDAFGSDRAASPVIRALLHQAYNDPALTERVRKTLEVPPAGDG